MTLVLGVCAATLAGLPADAAAATVRSARVSIVFSPQACEVTSRLVIDTAEPEVVEHRLLLAQRSGLPEFVVVGALAGDSDTIGSTVRLPVSLTGSGRNEYTVRYRVALSNAAHGQCPLLVPAAPTDGISRAIRLEVDMPADATRLPGAFPALSWDERRGTVTIGHMPSFVRVPFATRGAALGWRETFDVRRAMDVSAVVTIGIATAAWAALRKRRA
jgi:hypothetical protein